MEENCVAPGLKEVDTVVSAIVPTALPSNWTSIGFFRSLIREQ